MSVRAMTRLAAVVGLVGVTTVARPGAAGAQQTTWDGVFTAEQAERGGEIYGGMCASCHGPQLGGIDAAPGLNGGSFYANWDGYTLGEMADRVRISMPSNMPGVMSRQQVVDVLAYIFSRNGMPPGSRELPRQSGPLKAIVFKAQRGG